MGPGCLGDAQFYPAAYVDPSLPALEVLERPRIRGALSGLLRRKGARSGLQYDHFGAHNQLGQCRSKLLALTNQLSVSLVAGCGRGLISKFTICSGTGKQELSSARVKCLPACGKWHISSKATSGVDIGQGSEKARQPYAT